MSSTVSLIDGHIDDPSVVYKLKAAFKQVNYPPIDGAVCKANLYNQFSDYALNSIINQLVNLGVTFNDKEVI